MTDGQLWEWQHFPLRATAKTAPKLNVGAALGTLPTDLIAGIDVPIKVHSLGGSQMLGLSAGEAHISTPPELKLLLVSVKTGIETNAAHTSYTLLQLVVRHGILDVMLFKMLDVQTEGLAAAAAVLW